MMFMNTRLGRVVAMLVTIAAAWPHADPRAQSTVEVVAVSAEPDHKIRFDNGIVRMYEVSLPKGKSTRFHEHRDDSFSIFFSTGAVSAESPGGKVQTGKSTAGMVRFASTAKGPYTHRVEAGADDPFRVIALELMQPPPNGGGTPVARRPDQRFNVVLENTRGRAYRLVLEPGESIGPFDRAQDTAIFAITGGRISERVGDRPARLWDFDPVNFRWSDSAERLSLKNEGSARIELVEIEVY